MDLGKKRLVFLGAFVVIVCLAFILYFGSSAFPKFVVKVDENDFSVIDIRYEQIFTRDNESTGLAKLTVQTNRDNLIITASSKTRPQIGCSWEFGKAGALQTMTACIGDPVREFMVYPIDIEHEFEVCARVPWSLFYEREPVCKSIFLPPYQE